MFKRFLYAFLLFIAMCGTAFADAGSTVTWTYGDWIQAVLGTPADWLTAHVSLVYAGLFTVLARFIPAPLLIILKGFITEKMFARALTYATNMVKGATHGQTFSVDVGNQIIAHMLQYILDMAPKWLISFWGGEEGIIKMIVARLPLEATASAENVAVPVTSVVSPKLPVAK